MSRLTYALASLMPTAPISTMKARTITTNPVGCNPSGIVACTIAMSTIIRTTRPILAPISSVFLLIALMLS